MGIGNRLLNAILNIITAIFNIPIRSKYVVLVLILSVTGSIWYTRRDMLNNVGGKDEYNEAMRYIQIKDVVDSQYIDDVNREIMGDNAAAAKLFEQAAKVSENDFTTPMYLRKAALAYKAMGDAAKAEELLKVINEQYPASYDAREAIKLVD